MASSNRYNDLKSRILQLEDHLLPTIDPDLNYSDKDQDLTRAYCLLCHAEFEAYLEDITKEVVTKAYARWSADKSIISPIIFHLAYSYKQEAGKQKDAPYSMVVKSYLSLVKYIEKNNGIKEDNLNGFFKPIGFEIDSTLQSTLNNFGKSRGEIAHTSFHTQQPLDPATEKNTVNMIVTALNTFDTDLIEYEASGRLNRTPVNMNWKHGFSIFNSLKNLFR